MRTVMCAVPPGAAAAPRATLLGLHCGPDVFTAFFSLGGGGWEAGGDAGAQRIDKRR